MKALSILIFTISIFYGEILNFKTYQANFVQTVTNSSGNKIIYKGKIYLDNKSNILWRYIKPITKDVYINDTKVMIVEPELEQVIISRMDKELNLIDILNQSHKISKNIYENKINNIVYKINIVNNNLKEINYIDDIDNKIEITFNKINGNFNMKIFDYNIPDDFDIIRK